ncbi:helix-turn-helix domain-containing protein [Actinomycetospora termitidis]|uniref:Helix-turn-helix domain-containing protein n=1 Tax=Actinomycetospora termitidis TaxID=3053470 RepID=A0ABT7MDP1_9PSEU|nr:helix-turn-helix domain-containing protein [Actinomycetospora sp. Odt1-22]MDL5158784.1 helix-turn-helix domain-containing protein [Actinomycetospora sp. Odt1-22]
MTTELCERERLALTRDSGPASRRVLASWKRSAGYGIALDSVDPAFAGAVDDQSLFYEAGHEILAELHASLADEPVSLMLTDVDGLVLNRLCRDRRLLTALDAVSLAPGFDYSERTTGTTGLGLALADRVPTLVRGDQHYCTRLWGYTCAAVPVTDPVTGDLAGSVNLTTWSQRSHTLLLALARTAATATEALMLARGRGRSGRPSARGRVVRVPMTRDEAGARPREQLGASWEAAAARAAAALPRGGVAVVGEPGAGRSALLGEAHARGAAGRRVLQVRPPDPEDVADWLALWCPELHKPGTSVIVARVDHLPAWAADELVAELGDVDEPALSVTARDAEAVPEGLRPLVGTVVELPALRHRPEDVLPLAARFARERRGRPVRFTADAEQALAAYHWPGNVAQLRDVVRRAVTGSDVVGERDLPPEVFTGGRHRLTRMEALERDEIVRCLAEPGATPARAAAALGMSRSTVYRRIARYGIRIPTGADQE